LKILENGGQISVGALGERLGSKSLSGQKSMPDKYKHNLWLLFDVDYVKSTTGDNKLGITSGVRITGPGEKWLSSSTVPFPEHVQIEKGCVFNAEKSRLYIDKKEIKIRKFSNQYHLLRVIFKDQKEVGKEWFFSEIAEKVDHYSKKNKNKKYYNAVFQIKKKLESVGLNDFFITTRQSLKINTKYLS
jgi:hypothetical protein